MLLFIISTVTPIIFGYNLSETFSSEKCIISVQSEDVISESSTSLIETTKTLRGMDPNRDYSHTVFVEVATSQSCGPCHYLNENLYNHYNSGDYDFEFVEMIIYDHKSKILNYKANLWAKSYNIWKYPTSIFDGDYRRLEGNYGSQIPNKLNDCGYRNVKDITTDMTVSWLGNAKMKVEISIQNNEDIQYNGYIRACITEIISRYDTYQGDPYHFGFLDYAFNKDISIPTGGVYTDTIIWNGNEHKDNQGNYFGDIAKDNIRVILGVFNEDNDYVDATVATNPFGDNFPPNEPKNPLPLDGSEGIDIDTDLSWTCSDPDGEPITFDVYFGTSSPPPLISSHQVDTYYDLNRLDYDIKYYWKIIAFDNHGASTSGPIWSLNTKKKEDNILEVEILKPSRALYLNNQKIISRFFLPTFVIGDITIEVEATDKNLGIEKVEFYINGKLTSTDTTEPYSYDWTQDRLRLFHLFLIKVIAYNNNGDKAVKQMIIRKYL